jgi:superfamily II DNA or RNA helicase
MLDESELDREKVYIDRYMYVPKHRVNVPVLRAALMYGEAESEAVPVGAHMRIPRHYPIIPDAPPVVTQLSFPESKASPKTPLRDYQIEPFLSMCSHKGGILNLGCGYGKTFLALSYIAARGLKAIVLLDKINLLDQWRSEALKHLDIDESRIGWVQGKRWDWEEKDIVLASLATVARRAKDGKIPEGFCESFGVAVYDECHHLSAAVFAKTCPLFYGERHGLTATPNREDGLEEVFFNHLGPVHYSKIDQELIPQCFFLHTGVNADRVIEEDHALHKRDRKILDSAGEIHHRKLCRWLGEQRDRNLLICHLANRLADVGHHVLCVTHSVDHAKHLSEYYVDCGLACGDVDPSERRAAIKDNRVSFATVDVAAEALDVSSLSALIVMTPFGARNQGNLLQQALGRIQRRHESKHPPVAYFIEDVEVHMARALIKQCKKKLRQWAYPTEVINVRGSGGERVAPTSELHTMPLIPNEEEHRIRYRESRGEDPRSDGSAD